MPAPDQPIIKETRPHTFFVLTANGDWMDMTPEGPLTGPAVDFYAVDLDADVDDLDYLANSGSGQLLGRAFIQDDNLHLQRPVPALEPQAQGPDDDQPPGLSLVMERALRIAADTADSATEAVARDIVTQHAGRVDTHGLGLHAPADAHEVALAAATHIAAAATNVTTVAWTYTSRGTLRDLDIPADLLIVEGLDIDGTHVAAACLNHTTPKGTYRGPWYRIRAAYARTNPWDIEKLHDHLTR